MKERPILFSAPMVRAILDGRKTMTRRVVSPQPEWRDIQGLFASWVFKGGLLYPNAKTDVLTLCPYGQPGDRLWVREAHALEHEVDGNKPPHADGRPVLRHPADDVEGMLPGWTQPHYRATDPAPDLCCERTNCAQCRDQDMGPHWRPSIHMPRWASRITLEIIGVRVERLQAISEAEAAAEGIECVHRRWWLAANDGPSFGSAGAGFRYLWESINGYESWDANP